MFAPVDAAQHRAHDERRVLRIFEKRFLDALGFGIDYAHCLGTGDGVRAERYYLVDPQQGVVGETSSAHPAAASARPSARGPDGA